MTITIIIMIILIIIMMMIIIIIVSLQEGGCGQQGGDLLGVCWGVKVLFRLGMFPLILTVLNGDSSRGNYNPS